MRQLGNGLGALLLLAACSAPILGPGRGSMQIAVKWPQAGFRTQTIPAAARSIAVSVSGQGLERPRRETLSRNGSETQTLVIDLPLGSKQVEVKAFDGAGNLVAEDRQPVEIRVNQTARLEMSLQSVTPVIQQPGPNPGSTGTGTGNSGATDMPGASGGTDTSGNQPGAGPSSQPSTSPSTPPSGTPSVAPSSTTVNGSSGGGGGGGGSSVQVTMTLTADPAALSGIGFSTQLKLSFSDAGYAASVSQYLSAHPGALTLSCADGSGNPSCASNFSTTSDPLRRTWTASQGGSFTLGADLTDQNNVHFNQTVTVTVNQGSGTIGLGNGGFDGGEAGPAT